MASHLDYVIKESDSNRSIPEKDVCLILNVQPYRYELLRRKKSSQHIFNEVSESEPSQIYDEDPTETENMPPDLDW